MYNICPKCGASLDPGERCDCDAPGREAEAVVRLVEKSGKADPETVSRYVQEFRNRVAALERR